MGVGRGVAVGIGAEVGWGAVVGGVVGSADDMHEAVNAAATATAIIDRLNAKGVEIWIREEGCKL